MEDRTLSLAHAHARKAAAETARSNLRSAGQEHELAAGNFSRASKDTSDSEALRILTLLEDHHRKLADILKTRDQHGKKEQSAVNEDKVLDPPISPIKSAIAPSQPFATPEKHTPTFLKGRDAPSSLAKDIASRRGIPPSRSTPKGSSTVSAVQATGRLTATSTMKGQQSQGTERAEQGSAPATPGDTDETGNDGFARFYSSLTTGPFSKLSSMLAFAGVPLTEAEESPTASRTVQTSARVPTGPNPDRLFSKAALRALEEQQRHPGHGFGPHESFYVIPTSGGTASYANILSKTPQDGKGHMSRTSEDFDEFVDAREVIDKRDESRRPMRAALREEELAIENEALKQILDKLSHRLQAFESHAQDASMHALAQSMVSMRPSASSNAQDMEGRMRAMESQLVNEMRERERLAKESHKKDQIIAKYRNSWEQLKETARAKEKAKREKAATGGLRD